MMKITEIQYEKTNKNKKLTATISKKILSIAENPAKNFKRYTIGFDANLMRILLFILGYRVFNMVIRKFVSK